MARDPQFPYSQDPELYVPPTATQSHSNKLKVEEQRTPFAENPRICGIRRATFWLVLLLMFVIIVAAVGGGVGGSIAVQNAKSKNAPESLVTATATASSSSNPSSPSASATFTTYTPLAPSAVPFIDNTCPGGTISSLGKKYDCNDQREYADNDITGIIAYSLSACIDACTTYNLVNIMEDTPSCKAVALSSALKASYGNNKGANCWLKKSIDDKALTFRKDTTVAVLEP